MIRAELALSAKQPRAAVDAAREAAKFSDTWLGHVLLGRAHLQLAETAAARREFEIAIKRQGEATAILLDDVPTFRFLPPVREELNRLSGGTH